MVRPLGSGFRRLSRAVCAALVVGAGLVLAPAPAGAHAELESTEPAAGEQLDAVPDRVVLHFTEAVDVSDDGVEVLTSEGDRVDAGEPGHADGQRSSVAVDLPALDDGTYVVSWRVISSDSHPVSGAFTFGVGDAAAGASGADTQALVDDVLAGAGADRSLGVVYGVVRFAAFAGVVALVGGVLFVLAIWPAGVADRRARRILSAAWWTAIVATALSIPLQAAYAVGGALADAVDPSLVGDELGVRTGRGWLARLALLVVGAIAASRLFHRTGRANRSSDPSLPDHDGPARDRRPGAWADTDVLLPVALVGGSAVLATITFTGHAVSGDLVPLAVVTDLVHLGGVSVWLGGLAIVLGAVLARPDTADHGPGHDTADGLDDLPDRVVARFSQVAFAAVAVIVASGVVQAWRQLGSWDALVDTTYGRLLLVKVGLVMVMIAAAAVSRAWVRRRAALRVAALALSPGPGAAAASPEAGPARLSVLRRSVGVEVGLAVAVLAVTALLVNAVPGTTADDDAASEGGGGGGPFSTVVHGSIAAVDIAVDPAAVGPADVRIGISDHAGGSLETEEVTASLTLPDRDIGPLDVPLVAGSPGQYAAEGVEIPFAGVWQLEVVVRTSDIDQDRVTAEVPVS